MQIGRCGKHLATSPALPRRRGRRRVMRCCIAWRLRHRIRFGGHRSNGFLSSDFERFASRFSLSVLPTFLVSRRWGDLAMGVSFVVDVKPVGRVVGRNRNVSSRSVAARRSGRDLFDGSVEEVVGVDDVDPAATDQLAGTEVIGTRPIGCTRGEVGSSRHASPVSKGSEEATTSCRRRASSVRRGPR